MLVHNWGDFPPKPFDVKPLCNGLLGMGPCLSGLLDGQLLALDCGTEL